MKISARLSLITILAVLTLVLLSAVALADGDWINTSDGVKIWNPNPVDGEVVTWTGERDEEGYATGYGVLRWLVNGKIEQTYQGKMVKGKLHGKGTYQWIEGTCYEGDYIDNEFSGKGMLNIPKVGLYVGDFVNGKMHGKGTFKFINGSRYEGEVANDKFQGKGLYRWPNGAFYKGDFVDGTRTGEGIYTFADGSRYQGEFLDGNFHGTGIFYSPDGDILKQGRWDKGNFVE